jgi:hypothetical protein
MSPPARVPAASSTRRRRRARQLPSCKRAGPWFRDRSDPARTGAASAMRPTTTWNGIRQSNPLCALPLPSDNRSRGVKPRIEVLPPDHSGRVTVSTQILNQRIQTQCAQRLKGSSHTHKVHRTQRCACEGRFPSACESAMLARAIFGIQAELNSLTRRRSNLHGSKPPLGRNPADHKQKDSRK